MRIIFVVTVAAGGTDTDRRGSDLGCSCGRAVSMFRAVFAVSDGCKGLAALLSTQILTIDLHAAREAYIMFGVAVERVGTRSICVGGEAASLASAQKQIALGAALSKPAPCDAFGTCEPGVGYDG